MTVPDARVELNIGGVWTDVTNDVSQPAGIRYLWGRRGEGSRVDPAAASFTLRNPTGVYSGRNPNSPHFGLLGRNTPVRVTHGGVPVALVIPSGVQGRATTPDTAALDILGDIDVRAHLTPSAWEGTHANGAWDVVSKFGAAGQRSWSMLLSGGGLFLWWSPDGTSLLSATATVYTPFAPGQEGAVRASLDVSNGAGGWTVTFYTAPTLAGPWTQLGNPVTGAGVTSIFNSTTPVEIGDNTASNFTSVSRQIHAVEIRNSAGTVVANPVFTAQASGTTSFTDAAGRAWSTANGAEITSRRIRAALEASSWTPRWGASGKDVTTPVEAAGILRRLGQGAKALASTLRRRLPSTGPVAYWPMEDGTEATQAYSPIAGCPPLRTADFTFAADGTCPGSDALPSIGAGATMQAQVPTYTSPSNGYLVAMLYSVDTMPASKSAWLSIQTTGTGRGIVMSFTSTQVICDVYGTGGALITSQVFSNTSVFGPGKWFRFDCSAQVNGGNTDIHLGFIDVESSGVMWNFSIAGTPGLVTDIDTAFGPLMSGMRVGHLGIYPSSDTSIWGPADNGYRGESVGSRLFRLGAEERLPITIAQGPDATTYMGPQRPSTLLDLLAECEAADDGVLYEDREQAGLAYRTRTTLYTQAPKVTIPYGQLAPPLEPTDDDRRLRNDRTVQRTGGSAARAVLSTGPLSVAAPPDGVGIYDDTQTLNVHLDSQVQGLAEWLLHRGTWDEARYPRVRVLLHKYPELIPAVAALQPGDVIRITDLPVWLPPGPIDLMVEGAEEEFKTLEWTITLSCSPAGPWSVGITDDEVFGRADTDGSVLGAAATPSDTALVVQPTLLPDTGEVPAWTADLADYPMDLRVGGEVVTATAAASLAADTFTRTVAAGSWGTSSDGHPWTLTGGPASDRSVAATYGVITLVATPTTNRYQTVGESARDLDIRASIAFSATATGGSLVAALIARWSSFTDHYRLRVEGTTAGGITLAVTRANAIVGSSVSTGVTYTPGSVIEVRMRVIGDRVLGRAWPTGADEPGTWHVDETVVSSPIAEGLVGLAGSGLTGNTNVSPEIRFHDWQVESPQRFTVTRSVNGISKSHSAGSDIHLAQPAITSY